MADKVATEEPQPQAGIAKPKKRLPLTLGIVLSVAIAEAAVFFIVFKFVGGGPQTAKAEGGHVVEAASQPVGLAEVPLLKGFRVPNDKLGRMYIYDLDLSVVVPEDHKERMEGVVKHRSAEIGDRIARIMRSATDRMLKEDDLRALRQQILEALREVVEDDNLVQRVLIPRFVPMRSD
jgi:flagellar basal body-associated protein FliL